MASKIGSELLINETTAGDQKHVRAVRLLDGRTILVWEDAPSGNINARFLAADGAFGSTELVLHGNPPSPIRLNVMEPELAALSSGGFAVSWTTFLDTPVEVRAYSATATPAGDAVTLDSTSSASSSSINSHLLAGLPSGGFVAALDRIDRGRTTSTSTGRLHFFDASNTSIGTVTFANLGPVFLNQGASPSYEPDIVSLPTDRVAVFWDNQPATSGITHSIIGQIYTSAGETVGTNFTVSAFTDGSVEGPAAAALGNGTIVVVWRANGALSGDGSGYGIRGQIIDTLGNRIGRPFLVNTQTVGDQTNPDVVVLPNGRFAVVWEDASGDGTIRLQAFNERGHKIGSEMVVNTVTAGAQTDVSVSVQGDNRLLVTWTDTSASGGDTSGMAVRGQIVEIPLPTTITGTEASETLTGDEGENVLAALAGNDTLIGGIGPDTMRGGSGDDIYAVDQAGDLIVEFAGEGNDTVFSEVSYSLPEFFSLPANVENLILVESANLHAIGNDLANFIYGNPGANHLDGGAGGDALLGFAGDDTLAGGAGIDGMAGGTGNDSYTAVSSIYDVILENPGEGFDIVYSMVTHALYANVEGLVLQGTADSWAIGNALGNHLVGNAGSNYIDGGAGADVLTGGGSVDTFRLRLFELHGDAIADFGADDLIQFEGYGAATTTVMSLGRSSSRSGHEFADASIG